MNSGAIAGVQIKSNYIGMATGENINDTIGRSLLSLRPGVIRMGLMKLKTGQNLDTNEPTSYDGNFLWLDNNEIYLGGMGSLTLNTDNIKI